MVNLSFAWDCRAFALKLLYHSWNQNLARKQSCRPSQSRRKIWLSLVKALHKESEFFWFRQAPPSSQPGSPLALTQRWLLDSKRHFEKRLPNLIVCTLFRIKLFILSMFVTLYIFLPYWARSRIVIFHSIAFLSTI